MTKIPSKPRTGAKSRPKFLGYTQCGYCKMPFMKWSDQGNTLFCSNICELTHERFDALRYWQKREEEQATSPNGKAVFPLVDPSREAEEGAGAPSKPCGAGCDHGFYALDSGGTMPLICELEAGHDGYHKMYDAVWYARNSQTSQR